MGGLRNKGVWGLTEKQGWRNKGVRGLSNRGWGRTGGGEVGEN